MSDIAEITTPTGDRVELPVVELSLAEARIVGAYCSWLSKERLIGTLYCRSCGPDVALEVYVDDTKIGMVCQHRMIVYEGPVPVVKAPYVARTPPDVLVLSNVIPTVPISLMDAQLLRQYKKFLLAHGLQEALHCLWCEEEERESGVRAYVTESAINVTCRCASREHKGIVH